MPPPGSPGPGPYGPPPPPPPPGGSSDKTGAGWIVALITGIVALIAVIVVGLVLIVGDDDAEATDTDRESSSTPSGSDEDQIRQVVTDAMTRWGKAEMGDASACEGLDELIEGHGEDVEAQCQEEVGSHDDGKFGSVEVKNVQVDGDKATAEITIDATDDAGEDDGFTREVKVLKVDGHWKVSFE